MAAKLSALLTGRAILPRNIIFLLLVLIPVRGLEPATFRLVATNSEVRVRFPELQDFSEK
jgi:hypothetical protein